MRGRRPRSLAIAPDDVESLRAFARRLSAPWFQVRRARIVLAVADGERVQEATGPRGRLTGLAEPVETASGPIGSTAEASRPSDGRSLGHGREGPHLFSS